MSSGRKVQLKLIEVYLDSPAEIIQFSYIVQNSISPLNLEFEESHLSLIADIYRERFIRRTYSHWEKPGETRNLLDIFHLDMPKKTSEVTWKPFACSKDNRSPYLSKIKVGPGFYFYTMSELVERAWKRTEQNFKLLRMFIKLNIFVNPRLPVPDYLLDGFIDYMISGLADLEFVKESFRKLNFNEFCNRNQKPEKLEKLLLLLNQFDRNEDIAPFISNFIAHCLCFYQNVAVVLKFQGTALFDKECLENWLPFVSVFGALNRNPDRRSELLNHLCVFFRWSDSWDGFEALRLFWDSISDPFLSHTEITTRFEVLHPDTAENISKFYTVAVDRVDSISPRPLLHLCRTVIRQRLWENKEFIPDGIKKTGLPLQLQSYLNLDKQAVRTY